MPPQLASFRTHTDAVVLALRTAELTVFDAAPPALDVDGGGADWGWQGPRPGAGQFKPYVIVYPLSGGIFDGTLGCPDDDASLTWQLTCVGAVRRQCEWMADRALAALVGRRLTVADRGVSRVYADMAGGGARRDDTVQPPVFIATPRIRADSMPILG
jgi:hypothetical protein